MIHGDLKGVRFGFKEMLTCLTVFTRQGERTGRPNSQCPPSGLRSPHDNLGPRTSSDLEFVCTGWYSPVDGSGTHLSEEVWVEDQLPDKTFGLLFPWDGHIRNHQRESAFP